MMIQLPLPQRILLGGASPFPPPPNRGCVSYEKAENAELISAEYVYPSEFSPNLTIRVKTDLANVVALSRPLVTPPICCQDDPKPVPAPIPQHEQFYFGKEIREQLANQTVLGTIYLRDCSAVVIQTEWVTTAKDVAARNFPLPFRPGGQVLYALGCSPPPPPPCCK